jgi:hypothetical protein
MNSTSRETNTHLCSSFRRSLHTITIQVLVPSPSAFAYRGHLNTRCVWSYDSSVLGATCDPSPDRPNRPQVEGSLVTSGLHNSDLPSSVGEANAQVCLSFPVDRNTPNLSLSTVGWSP